MQSSARCLEPSTSRGDVRALESHRLLELANSGRIGEEHLRPSFSRCGTGHDQCAHRYANAGNGMSDGHREKLAGLLNTHLKSLPVRVSRRRLADPHSRNDETRA